MLRYNALAIMDSGRVNRAGILAEPLAGVDRSATIGPALVGLTETTVA